MSYPPQGYHAIVDIFDKYRDFVPIIPMDTTAWIIEKDGTGSVSNSGSLLTFTTDDVTGNKTFIRASSSYEQLTSLAGLVTAEWVVRKINATDSTVWLLFIVDSDTPPDELYTHFGFKIINGRVWATSCADPNQEITDTGVDLVNVAYQFTRLKVVVNPGVDVKFYVNGVLKVTHTENLPAEDAYYFLMGITTGADAGKVLGLGRFLLEKAYA